MGNGARSMKDMLELFIGAARQPGDASRIVGFVGLVDYEEFLGTSLKVPPTQGYNILPTINEFARETIPDPQRTGIVCGFVRTDLLPMDDEETRELYHRMFYDNPRDDVPNSKLESRGAEGGAHWISHTHGALLARGALPHGWFAQSLFGAKDDDAVAANFMERMAANDAVRKRMFDGAFAQMMADVGHVVPNSLLRRYFFQVFDV